MNRYFAPNKSFARVQDTNPLAFFDTLQPGTIIENGVDPTLCDSILDISGNGFHLQNPDANDIPMIDDSTYGFRTLFFDGSNKFLFNDTFTITSFPCTLVYVAAFSDDIGTEIVGGFGSTSDSTEYAAVGKSSENPMTRVQSGLASMSAVSTYALTPGEKIFVVGTINDENSRTVEVNRSNSVTDVGFEAYPANSQRIKVGGRPSASTASDFDGWLMNFAVYDYILPANALDDYYQYCRGRYKF